LFYEEPLSERSGAASRGREPLALAQWRSLTAGRYLPDRGFLFVRVERIRPADRMNAPERPGPEEWLGIVTDASGHSAWFVDPEDRSEDPPVFHWDDEGGKTEPTRAFHHLSQLLTLVVVSGTLEREPDDDEGLGPLGEIRPEVRSLEDYGELVRAHVEQLQLVPWPIHGLEVRSTPDRSLLLNEEKITTRTEAAWKPIARLLVEEEAEQKEKQRADDAQRTAAVSRELASAGSPVAAPDLLRALEAIEAELTVLEKVFLQDFRSCLAAGNVFDGQRRRAAQILAKHPRGAR